VSCGTWFWITRWIGTGTTRGTLAG